MELADGSPRYRIVAAEAHSWSTLILAHEHGGLTTFNAGTGRMSVVTEDDVNQLLATRVYRAWHGSQEFATLDRLPTAAQRQPASHAPLDSARESGAAELGTA